MIVVDSSVWISHFGDVEHPEVKLLRSIGSPETILVGDLILVEVLKGARSDKAARLMEQELAEFDQIGMVDPQIARVAAINYRRLRDTGITIRSSVDLLIATYCIAHGHQLLHRDRDFEQMRSLGLEIYAG